MTALTNASGAVTDRYEYDAFGNTTVVPVSAVSTASAEPNAAVTATSNPFRYCGEYWDSETGTYYLRARYYNPALGRFTQQDAHWSPANRVYGDSPQRACEYEDRLGLNLYSYAPQLSAIRQSGNLYVYCVNNPVLYQDPTGESIILASILIGAAIGAILGGVGGAVLSNAQLGYVDWNWVAIGSIGGGILGGFAGWGVGAAMASAGAATTAATCSGTLGGSGIIYSTWQQAEQAVRDAYNAVKHTFSQLAPGMSNRIVDGYNEAQGIIYEVKYGYASLSSFIQSEIIRDVYLMQSGQVNSVEWHFFISNITGRGGPSAPLLEALLNAGIKVVFH